MPKERLDILRRAFDAMVKDPALLAEVEKLKLDLTPLDGVELETLVRSIVATSAGVVQKAQAAMVPKDIGKAPGADAGAPGDE
jgi:hypothetical protein